MSNRRLRDKMTTNRRRLLLASLGAAVMALLCMASGLNSANAASFVVDTTSDASLTACTGASSDCSLRGAISNAAASGAADTITFDPGVFHTESPNEISPASALPDLSGDGDVIDATDAGVRIEGSSGFDCLTISGDGNTVVGIEAIVGCSNGVVITGADNTIGGANSAESGGQCSNATDDDDDGYVNDGCPIDGASPESGTDCHLGSSANDDAGDDSVVNDGCPARGEGTVIQGNVSRGIEISGAGATGNFVLGNYIGTDDDGVSAFANGGAAVRMSSDASNNTIGGTTAAERNILSGNSTYGVNIVGSSSTGNVVIGNYIGTDATGTSALANSDSGVQITSAGNTVGGTTAAERNVISGNTVNGVLISGATATGNTVSGNYVGLNAAGDAAIPNLDGVFLNGAPFNTIGGDSIAERNIISGNTLRGIEITGSASTGNTVSGNYIGVNPAGTSSLPNGTDGIRIHNGANSNAIGGDTTGERNIISGNSTRGVDVLGVSGTVISGNYIGTNLDGTAAVANGTGVHLQGGATLTTVGGSTAGERNIISGNTIAGIGISAPGTDTNDIIGNYIGLNAAGTAAIPNGDDGIGIGSGAFNTIGGNTPGERNVISGNTNNGVLISGATATGNTVSGNYIGTDNTGTSAVANGGSGVEFDSGASSNTIGGDTAGDRNVISGNTVHGVHITGSGTDSNTVSGNYIGTNAAGSADVGNLQEGVRVIFGASGNTIGGTTAGEGNVVSGNNQAGVRFQEAGTDGNFAYGNKIGTDASGTAGIANTGDGVLIFNGASNNTVGGTSAGQANLIAFNGQNGICAISEASDGNSFRANAIRSNTRLGIDLTPSGDACGSGIVTENDAGDSDTGPNDLMNFPVITSASFNGVNTTISGTLDTSSPATSVVDVFNVETPDASGNGEGDVYLGAAVPTGGGAWSLVMPGLADYAYFSATATDASDNTSEFSDIADTDYDGDGFANSVDNCDFDYNGLQLDNDGDGIGDVCDDAVRNRISVEESSIVESFSTEPGQPIPAGNRALHPWDYEPGSSINIGAIVGTLDLSRSTKIFTGACVGGPTNAITLYNASVDNSPGNLVDTVDLNGDSDGDGIPNGVEGYPRFLNTIYDRERRTGIDEDGDGVTDEDGGVAGVDDDADTLVDEDGAGTPDVPHARFYGTVAGEAIQVLVSEVIADEAYGVGVLFGDTTRPPNFIICSPLELTLTIQDTTTTNTSATPNVPGGQTLLNDPPNGTRPFTLETFDPPDADGDGVDNLLDNCRLTANTDQADGDGDGLGDACDPGQGSPDTDEDSDGRLNYIDNCATVPNSGQEDSELRTPVPFGLTELDSIGDACDPSPFTGDNANEVAINRYSDAICVTGGGFTDTDGDGWCGEDADPAPGGASKTPEDEALALGSCNNGVDDDGDTLLDIADPDCADADGDEVPDNIDLCPEAADPLRLDTDADGTGDACEDAMFSSLDVVETSDGANSELRHRWVEVAPDRLHRRDGTVIETSENWGIASSASVPIGAIRGALASQITTSIDPIPVCNHVNLLNYSLLNASTNPLDTIAPGNSFAALVAESGNGIPDGAEQYPDFLTKLSQTFSNIDDDLDTLIDEDPIDFIDNDQDSFTDEDPYNPVAPLVRMYGDVSFQGATHVVNVLVYGPGVLPAFSTVDGYVSLIIHDDPFLATPTGEATAFCTHEDHRIFRYGVSLDNPSTGAGEGGVALLTNDSGTITEKFSVQATRLPDLDGDGIENALDTCPFEPDNDNDTINDNIDPSPWNPRLVAPPGDTDSPEIDGLPNGCDPDPNNPSQSGSGPDEDGDHLGNDEDNCDLIYNPDQTDSDVDDIGDICEVDAGTDPFHAEGSAQSTSQTTTSFGNPYCPSAEDADGDSYCNDVDPDPTKFGVIPENSAYDRRTCTDMIDNDEDKDVPITGGIDVYPGYGGFGPDAGCGDYDMDSVLDRADNCWQDYNPDQLDSDSDTGNNIGQDPFLASGVTEPPGPPVQGQPFLASFHWGGDACDPDDDNDGLADGSEPPGCQFDRDCDDDRLWDLFEWESTCLNPVSAADGVNGDPDMDGLPNYVEQEIKENPCVATACSDIDQDGSDRCTELWVGTDPNVSCVAPGSGPSSAWALEIDPFSPPASANKVNIRDLQTFILPVRQIGKSFGDPGFDKRWDLDPGRFPFSSWINVADLQAMVFTVPQMAPFNGAQRAFNGPACIP